MDKTLKELKVTASLKILNFDKRDFACIFKWKKIINKVDRRQKENAWLSVTQSKGVTNIKAVHIKKVLKLKKT